MNAMIPNLAAVIALLLASAVASASPFGREPTGDQLVKVRLELDHTSLTPGVETELAVVFRVEPRWHFYWRNAGDTGMPPSIRLNLPPGVTAGEIRWPVPARYQHTRMLDYIYEGEVALLIPLTVAQDATPGDASITAQIDWLVCEKICLAGAGVATLGVRIAEVGAEVSRNQNAGPLFDSTRARLPQPADAAILAGVSARWDGLTLVLHAPGAERLEWFPYAPYDGPPADSIRDGAGNSDTLRVEYVPRARGFDTFRGVLAVRRVGTIEYYEIVSPGPGG